MKTEEINKFITSSDKTLMKNNLENLSKEDVKDNMQLLFYTRSKIVLVAVQKQLECILEEASLEDQHKILQQLLATRCNEVIKNLVVKRLPTNFEDIKVFLAPIFKSRSPAAIEFTHPFLPLLSKDEVKILLSNILGSQSSDETLDLIPHLKSVFEDISISPKNLISLTTQTFSSNFSKKLIEIVLPFLELIKNEMNGIKKKEHIVRIVTSHRAVSILKDYASELLNTLPLERQLECIPSLTKTDPNKVIRNKKLKLHLSGIIIENLEALVKLDSNVLSNKSIQKNITELSTLNEDKSHGLVQKLELVKSFQKERANKNMVFFKSMNRGLSFFTDYLRNRRTIKIPPLKRDLSFLQSSIYEPEVEKKINSKKSQISDALHVESEFKLPSKI